MRKKDKNGHIKFNDITGTFCDSKFCYAYDNRYTNLYRNDDHINANGAKKLLSDIENILLNSY